MLQGTSKSFLNGVWFSSVLHFCRFSRLSLICVILKEAMLNMRHNCLVEIFILLNKTTRLKLLADEFPV